MAFKLTNSPYPKIEDKDKKKKKPSGNNTTSNKLHKDQADSPSSPFDRHTPEHMAEPTDRNRRKLIKAQQRLKKTYENRGMPQNPDDKTFLQNKFGGKDVAGEYKMGMADMRLFGGPGRKAIRDSGKALEGDGKKYGDKNRKKLN